MTTPSSVSGSFYTQPAFDTRITTMAFPLQGLNFGVLQRGFMTWDPANPPTGAGGVAQVNFLYNPSTVTASYNMLPSSVGAGVLFPTAYSTTTLAVPLSQSVQFSLLFDRTYELWGSYSTNGTPNSGTTTGATDPATIGVLADIWAMEQFTGMWLQYSSGNTGTTSPAALSVSNAAGWQGIIQMIPSYVYFGGTSTATTSLWYYGYISEWDVTVTHWTQYMVPARCVINVTLTMLPPPNGGAPGLAAGGGGVGGGGVTGPQNAGAAPNGLTPLTPGTAGVGGN